MVWLLDIYKKISKNFYKFLVLFSVLFLTACEGCKTVNQYQSEGIAGNCFMCRFFKVVTDAAAASAESSWNKFAQELSMVVMYATVIYVGFYTLKHVGSFNKADTATYLSNDKTGIISICFKMAVICAILRDPDNFFVNDILIPMFEAGVQIGATIATQGAEIAFTPSTNSGWTGFFETIYKTALAFNDAVYFVMALGKAFNCHGTRGIFIIQWELILLVYGTFLYIYGWFLLMAVSFYLIDVMLTLTFGAVLLPFGLAFFMSNQTKGYSQRNWQLFLNSFFSFVILGVVIGFIVQIIEVGMGKGNPSAPTVNSFLSNFDKRVNNNDVVKLSNELLKSGSFFLTFVSLMMLSCVCTELKKLVSKVTGSSVGTNSEGSKVGNAIMKPALKTGKAVLGGASDRLIKRPAKAVGKSLGRVISSKTEPFRRRIVNKYNLAPNTSIRDAASMLRGKITGTGRHGYMFWGRDL